MWDDFVNAIDDGAGFEHPQRKAPGSRTVGELEEDAVFAAPGTHAHTVGVEGEGPSLAAVHGCAVHPDARGAVGAERKDSLAVLSPRDGCERIGGLFGGVRPAA